MVILVTSKLTIIVKKSEITTVRGWNKMAGTFKKVFSIFFSLKYWRTINQPMIEPNKETNAIKPVSRAKTLNRLRLEVPRLLKIFIFFWLAWIVLEIRWINKIKVKRTKISITIR